MIADATWYLGSNDRAADLWGPTEMTTASFLYDMERGNFNGKQCENNFYCSDTVERTTTWTGKVGLIYPSDYAYATSGDITGTGMDRSTCLQKQVGNVSPSSTPNWSNTYSDCKENDWLINTSMWTWTISPRAYTNYGDYVFYVRTLSYVGHSHAMDQGSVRPVVYLKSNVMITSGDGTQAKPFELSYE